MARLTHIHKGGKQMKTTKKVLSIVLCISMLLGVLSIGSIFAFADGETGAEAAGANTVPTYAELQQKYTENFLYAGLDAYESGKIETQFDTPTDFILIPGRTIRFNAYIKSDKDIYSGRYYVIYDSTLFRLKSWDKDALGEVAKGGGIKNRNTNNININEETVSGFTKEEIANWNVLIVSDTVNETVRETKSDSPLFYIDMEVKKDLRKSDAVSSGGIFFIPEAFGNNVFGGTDETAVPFLYVGGTNEANKNAIPANLEIGSILNFDIMREASYDRSDGKPPVTFLFDEGDIMPPPEAENAYGWVRVSKDAEGNDVLGTEIVDFHKARMGKNNERFKAIKNDQKVTVTFDAGEGTVKGQQVITEEIEIGNGIDLSQYAPDKKAGLIFGGWQLDGTIRSGKYEFTSTSPLTFTAKWGSNMSIMIPDMANGGWKAYKEFEGAKGATMTKADFDEIKAMVIEPEADGSLGSTLKEDVIEAIGSEFDLSFLDLAFDDEGVFTVLSRWNDDGTSAFDVVYGETTQLYLEVMTSVTCNRYTTNYTEDGSVDVDNKWVAYRTESFKWLVNTIDGTFVGDGDIKDFTFVIRGGAEGVINDIQAAELPVYNENRYNPVYKDGNGKVYQFDEVQKSFYIYDMTEGKYNTFDLYVDLSEKVYKVAFETNYSGEPNKVVSIIEAKYGDTINQDTFLSLYRANDVSADAPMFTLESLKDNGAAAGKPGVVLTDVYFTDPETQQKVSLLEGGSLEINDAALAALSQLVIIKSVSYPTIVLDSSWEESQYLFTVIYKDKGGEWNFLTEKSFKGSEEVTYDVIVNSDLQKIVNANIPSGEAQDPNQFTLENGTVTSKVNAHDGPMILKITYVTGQRYVFADFSNNNTEENIGYKRYSASNGDIIYQPDYDPDSGEKAPIVNAFDIGFHPTSNPDKTLEGYEPLMQEKKDEEGNVIINQLTGEPVMEEVVDPETGDPVDDETKPIYSDAKGDEPSRPYRNCEYMGFKIYHVETPYVNYADVPAQDQWLEGFESDDYRVYNTTIIKVIWKPDTDFLVRFYNTSNEIYSAVGKDGKWYYWSKERPCQKGEGMLNTDPENSFILMFTRTKETAELADGATADSTYIKAFSIGKVQLSPAFIPDLIPTIVTLIKSLIA